MISYSPAQILSNGKMRKVKAFTGWQHDVVSGIDIQFLKALGKVWLFVLPVLILLYSVTFSMSSNMAHAVVDVENLNYELLGTNLELQSQTRRASSVDVVTFRAADLGLYEPSAGQLRVYQAKKNYFSYQ